jgi:hypothetical protein
MFIWGTDKMFKHHVLSRFSSAQLSIIFLSINESVLTRRWKLQTKKMLLFLFDSSNFDNNIFEFANLVIMNLINSQNIY